MKSLFDGSQSNSLGIGESFRMNVEKFVMKHSK